MMNSDMRHLLYLFISICQIYAFRLIRSFLYMISYEVFQDDPLFNVFIISKTILIIGVFSSIFLRMRVKQENSSNEQNNSNSKNRGDINTTKDQNDQESGGDNSSSRPLSIEPEALEQLMTGGDTSSPMTKRREFIMKDMFDQS